MEQQASPRGTASEPPEHWEPMLQPLDEPLGEEARRKLAELLQDDEDEPPLAGDTKILWVHSGRC